MYLHRPVERRTLRRSTTALPLYTHECTQSIRQCNVSNVTVVDSLAGVVEDTVEKFKADNGEDNNCK